MDSGGGGRGPSSGAARRGAVRAGAGGDPGGDAWADRGRSAGRGHLRACAHPPRRGLGRPSRPPRGPRGAAWGGPGLRGELRGVRVAGYGGRAGARVGGGRAEPAGEPERGCGQGDDISRRERPRVACRDHGGAGQAVPRPSVRAGGGARRSARLAQSARRAVDPLLAVALRQPERERRAGRDGFCVRARRGRASEGPGRGHSPRTVGQSG